MSEINQVIDKLFAERWCGALSSAPIGQKRAQLFKTLKNQMDGYWSGSTAYGIAVDGGFLIDAKSGVSKKLTAMGQVFMDSFKEQTKED